MIEGTALFNTRGTKECGPPKKTIYALDAKLRRLHGISQVTLDWWKCYLDRCASYHTFFVKELLSDVEDTRMVMKGTCNAGIMTTNK